jgi:uncharacterized delta-60 repeat protein
MALWSWLTLAFSCTTHAQWGTVDTTFQPGGGNNSGLDADVFAIAVQPDGKILIGGNFTKIGRTTRNRVARLNANGSLDSEFDPGTGASGLVEVLVRMPDGRVLIGGRFGTVQGQTKRYLARLDSTGGLDASFIAAPDDYVFAAAASPGGGVVIGGSFLSVDGTPRSGIARLTADGALDPAFNLVLDSTVHAIAVEPDGSTWFAGDFTTVQGLPRSRVARVLPDGTLDPAFNPGSGPTHPVTALALHPGARAAIGGAFTAFDEQPAWYVARLNSSGGLDSSFTPGIAPVWGGVLALHADGLGRLIVGGEFYTIDGASRVGIARLQPNGLLDRTFDPGSGVANSDGFSPLVRGVALQPDGHVLIGGRFTSVNGVKLNYLARLTGDAAVPIRFESIEPLDTDRLRLTVSAPVGAVCVLESSVDLMNWLPALTNQATAGACVFEPLDGFTVGRRLYRVVRR